MNDFETIIVKEPREGIVLATLNRPERLNAITFEMFDEFHHLCATVERDPRARVLVVTGSGRGFCSGLDLSEAQGLPAMTAPEMLAGQERWAGAIAAFRMLPKPVIAAVGSGSYYVVFKQS